MKCFALVFRIIIIIVQTSLLASVLAKALPAPPPPSIQKVTAGDTDITVENPVAGTDYDLYKWTPGVAGAAAPAACAIGTCVYLGIAKAQSSKPMDFKGIAQAPAAGDIILLTSVSGAILANATTAPSTTKESPRVIVGYEQSGANSANSAGRLYADAYYGRMVKAIG